jgi:hypothetical protein
MQARFSRASVLASGCEGWAVEVDRRVARKMERRFRCIVLRSYELG